MRRSQKRQRPKQTKEVQEQTSANRQQKNWLQAVLYFIVFIVGAVTVGAILSSLGIFTRRTTTAVQNNPDESSTLPLPPQLKEYRSIIYEPSPFQPIGYPTLMAQLGFCPSSELREKNFDFKKCELLTAQALTRDLDNAEIKFYNNEKVHTPMSAKEKAQIVSNMEQNFGMILTPMKIGQHERLAQFKENLEAELLSSSRFAQRLTRIFLQDGQGRFALYDVSPPGLLGGMGGAQYVMANNTLRIFEQNIQRTAITSHEMGHAAAVKISFPHPEKLPVWEFNEKTASFILNPKMGDAFPCDLPGFYELWKKEVLENIMRYRQQVFAEQQESRKDPQYREFLKKVSCFSPRFTMLMPSKHLKQLKEETGLKAGKKLNLSKSPFKVRFFPMPTKYDPGSNLFRDKDLQVHAMTHNSGLPGLSFIRVSFVNPQDMSIELRAKHFMDIWEERWKYVALFDTAGSGSCQEAMACTLEFPEVVLEAFLPRSNKYLHDRLNAYEAQKENLLLESSNDFRATL